MQTRRTPGFITPVVQRNTCLGTQCRLRPSGRISHQLRSCGYHQLVNMAGGRGEQCHGLLYQSLRCTGVYLVWLCLLFVVLVTSRDGLTSGTYLFLVRELSQSTLRTL